MTAGVSLSPEAAGRLSTDMSEARLHFLEKNEPKQFVFARLVAHSCPCTSIRVGISEERFTPATDFITDHHCLSRRLPAQSLAWTPRSQARRALSITVEAWLTDCKNVCFRGSEDGNLLQRRQACSLRTTASRHTGFHHGGSEGFVVYCFHGINRCIPTRIVSEMTSQTLLQLVWGAVTCSQSTDLKCALSLDQSALL